MARYSQWTAFKALTGAAVKSLIKSPSSVVFTVAFPLIFILGFGFLGNEGEKPIHIGITEAHASSFEFLDRLSNESIIKLDVIDSNHIDSLLSNNLVSAVLIPSNSNETIGYKLIAADTSKQEVRIAQIILDRYASNDTKQIVSIIERPVLQRSKIDFILTGQLGFSLLASSVFGVAFVFFGLRQELVLKRFFATPIRRWNILLAEGTARMIFQLLGAFLIIIAGILFFDITLAEGWISVVKMMLLTMLGVLIFMSFGFVISGLAKSTAAVPPLANIIVLPQFILAGTIFPISNFPIWLQWVAKFLPLTYLNEALRKVAVEGAGIWELKWEILILMIWGIAGYAFASFLFKWE